MNSEVFFIQTMRDIKTSLDKARQSPGIKTTSQVMRGFKDIQPKVNERQVAVALEQEKRRFVRQWQTLEKGRKKVKAYREKLAGTIEKNKRIMALRYDLQKQYWKREDEPVKIQEKSHSPYKFKKL